MTTAQRSLLVVYHTMTGGTLQLARATADAAGGGGAEVRLLHASDAGPDHVLRADGLVFATPEYLAAISGLMKDFFDRSYYAVLDRVNGRPYASLICAGSDGRNAARQIERIATGWRLRAIAEPIIVCTHAQEPDDILRDKRIGSADFLRCAELGSVFAAGLSLGIY